MVEDSSISTPLLDRIAPIVAPWVVHWIPFAHQITGRLGQRAFAKLYWRWLRWRRDPSPIIIQRYVREGDVVVDAGGGWGAYTDRFARLVGSSGRVHVFEPHPLNRGSLEAISSGRPNVIVHRSALSDRTAEAPLCTPLVHGRPITALSKLCAPDAIPRWEHSVAMVRVERLDAVLQGEGRPIAFLKCDVEGHELAVLRGAEETLRQSKPILLVEIEWRHAGTKVNSTFAYLAVLGYAGYALTLSGPVPLHQFDLERDQRAHLRGDTGLYAVSSRYIKDFLFLPTQISTLHPGRGE